MDVLPRNNLPPEAVPWGRGLESVLRDLVRGTDLLAEELSGGNRTGAAQSSVIARQVDTLQELAEEITRRNLLT